jgi:hypothetical protein
MAETALKTLEQVVPDLDHKKKNKYQAQIDYDKKRKQEDEEYRKKKNELVRKRNYERYHSDEAFKTKIKEAAKARTRKIMEIYKENKEVFKSLSKS